MGKGSFFFIPPLSWWCPFNNKFCFFSILISRFVYFFIECFLLFGSWSKFSMMFVSRYVFHVHVYRIFSLDEIGQRIECVYSLCFYEIFFGFLSPTKNQCRWFTVYARLCVVLKYLVSMLSHDLFVFTITTWFNNAHKTNIATKTSFAKKEINKNNFRRIYEMWRIKQKKTSWINSQRDALTPACLRGWQNAKYNLQFG